VGLRTACVELDDGEVSPTDSCMGEHMDYRAWLLQWENALPGPYAVSSGIVSRLQWNPNDPALSEEVSVVAAALARLRLLYGGLPEERLGERFLKITTHHASKVTGFNPTPFAHRGVPCTTIRMARGGDPTCCQDTHFLEHIVAGGARRHSVRTRVADRTRGWAASSLLSPEGGQCDFGPTSGG
jgi:hypothetical protein